MLKKWQELPKKMRNDRVQEYYQIVAGKQSKIHFKRMMDVFLASILTVLFAPVMIVIAVVIKIDSRGPVFYRQERITRYGKLYRIFKFRTMVMDADQKGPLLTQSEDHRITKVGQKLRKLRLDELPQLFNVLRGDMSFVGTRPEVAKYVEQYTEEMMATLLLPAGITSNASIACKDEDTMIAQYQKKYGTTVDETYVQYLLPEKMKQNLEYLERFGAMEDMKIMIKTALTVLR